MRIAPEKIPADPMPAIARPMISAVDVGAAPQITEPSSNKAMAVKKTTLTEWYVYSLPKSSWKLQVVRR